VKQKELEKAAFWEMDICLECAAVVQAEEGHFCPLCNCSPTIKAETALKVVALIEPEEGEEE
jgi:rRNA maturation endonuclease Nob1